MSWPSTLKLVLLPGLDGTSDFSALFQSCFPSTTDLISIDYPRDLFLDYDELARIVVDRLPESARFVLLAQSFSGPVAKRLFEHPRLAGVILCASFLSSPRPLLLTLLSWFPLGVVLRVRPPRFLIVRMCFGDNPELEQVDLWYRVLRLPHPDVLAHRLRLISSEPDPAGSLITRKPILYLRPSADRLIPQTAVEHLSALSSTVRIREISGAHFLLQTSPEAVVQEVCSFANVIEGKASQSAAATQRPG